MKLVSWSLTSLFSTNIAISETSLNEVWLRFLTVNYIAFSAL